MRIQLPLVAAVAALWLTGCASSSSSIKQTWKSPNAPKSPVQKIAVIAIDERGMVRKGFENRFVRDLGAHGQAAVVTHDLMSLAEIKADKAAASKALTGAGADAVLIMRLVDQTSYSRQLEARPEAYLPVTTGIGTSYDGMYGWYDYYEVAFMDMGASWGQTTQLIYLDSSLYDLKSGRRLWAAVTMTTLKEEGDRLTVADALTKQVVAAMRKAGLAR